MRRQSPRALNFNSVLEDADVHIVGNAVISMYYRVRDNFVQGLGRVLNALKALRAEAFDLLDLFDGDFDGSFDLIVKASLDGNRDEAQYVAKTGLFMRLIAVHFNAASFRQQS